MKLREGREECGVPKTEEPREEDSAIRKWAHFKNPCLEQNKYVGGYSPSVGAERAPRHRDRP